MEKRIKAFRYHDFSAGHRVVGHEGKCAHLHGHNYRVTFYCEAPKLDDIGRVIDFSVIKKKLCNWLEENWDHKMLIWDLDPMSMHLRGIDAAGIVQTRFNPTAENMAMYLVDVMAIQQLEGTGVILTKVVIEETRKCSASYEIQFTPNAKTKN